MKPELLPPPPVDLYGKWRAEVGTAAARCGPGDFLNVRALIETVIPGGAAAALNLERYAGMLVVYGYLYARDVDGLTSHVNLAVTSTAEAAAFVADVLLPRDSFERIWRREKAIGRRDVRAAVGILAEVFDVPYKAVAARAVELGLTADFPRDRRAGPARRARAPRRVRRPAKAP